MGQHERIPAGEKAEAVDGGRTTSTPDPPGVNVEPGGAGLRCLQFGRLTGTWRCLVGVDTIMAFRGGFVSHTAAMCCFPSVESVLIQTYTTLKSGPWTTNHLHILCVDVKRHKGPKGVQLMWNM